MLRALVVVAALTGCGGGRVAREPASPPADPEAPGDKVVRCTSNDDCAANEECDRCGTSSCPVCEDCVAICVAR